MNWNTEIDDAFSPPMQRYLALRGELARLREDPTADEGSIDATLDQMDEVWWSLTEDERNTIEEMGIDGV